MVPKFVKEALKNIIRQAVISVVSDDSEAYPKAQATANGKATDITRLSVYGLCSNPPLDSHVLMISSQAQEAVKFGVINDFLRRKKNLKEGEVALFNCITGAFVYLKADGSIEVESTLKVSVTAPETEINGNLIVNGDITATGDITSAELKVPGNPDYTVHKHGGVDTGPSQTSTPV